MSSAASSTANLADPVHTSPRHVLTSTRDGNAEIYVMDADGENQTNLTNHSAGDLHPRWSPDGSKIAFTSNRDGNAEIYVMDANGENPTGLTNTPDVDERQPAWSPDGSKIAFTSNRTLQFQVYVMDANGETPTQLTTAPANGEPDWQPIPVASADVDGFLSPVENPPLVNEVRAGQVVPLKWRLVDDNGDPVTDLASVHAEVQQLECDGAQTDNVLQEAAAGRSGLQNLGDGYYQWNWATPKSYAGSCKTLHLDVGEGDTRTADFSFVK